MVAYFNFKNIKSFAFKLVFWLCLGAFLHTVSVMCMIIVYMTADNIADNDFCDVTAFFLTIGINSCIIWIDIISYCCFQSVVKNN